MTASANIVLLSTDPFTLTLPSNAVVDDGGQITCDLAAAIAAAGGGGGGDAAVTIVETSANFSAEVGTHYEVDTTAGNLTGTVPDPSLAGNIGRAFTVVKSDASLNTISLSGATINGSASPFVISFQNSAATLRSTGTMWRVI